MVQDLVEIMLQEGMKSDDWTDIYESVADAVAEGRIKAIIKNGVPIGFFSWLEKYKNGKQYIWVNNLIVKRQYRNRTNLMFMRKFFKTMFPFCECGYWYSNKKKSYFYAKNKRSL